MTQTSITTQDFEISTCIESEIGSDRMAVELIGNDFDMDMELTPREARKLAHALLFMAEQAEAGE